MGAAPAVSSGVPQFAQNRTAPSFAAPQFGQYIKSVYPAISPEWLRQAVRSTDDNEDLPATSNNH